MLTEQHANMRTVQNILEQDLTTCQTISTINILQCTAMHQPQMLDVWGVNVAVCGAAKGRFRHKKN